MMKKILCLLLAAVLCCTPVLAAPAPAHHVEAKAAILYELNTDTVLLEQNADPTEEEIRRGLSGNLCRCTGYQQMVDAITEVAASRREADEK